MNAGDADDSVVSLDSARGRRIREALLVYDRAAEELRRAELIGLGELGEERIVVDVHPRRRRSAGSQGGTA